MPASSRRLLAAAALGATALAWDARAQQPTPPPREQPYFQFEPEQIARLLPESPAPRYPRALLARGVRGEVVAQFTVDTLGRVVPGSFSAERSTDPLFTRAVRANLANLRFQPAVIGGKKRNMLVPMTFPFDPSTIVARDSATEARLDASDSVALAADSAAAAADVNEPGIASYRFDDEAIDADPAHGLRIERRGDRDAVILWRATSGRDRAMLAALPLPGKQGAQLLVIHSCTLDGRPDAEVIGLVPVSADGHRTTTRPSLAWRASRARGRFESLPAARVRCQDEENVDG
jgi:TonB family protein